MAKYKVGDKVRIVSERPDSENFVGEMVRFLGEEITISMVKESDGVTRYYSEDAKPKNPVQAWFCKGLGVPGYYFMDEWISGLAEQKKPEFSVSVRFHGRLTVAELIKDGKVVKVENARCNPKDKYSMAEGARIAVERLFKKTADKPEEVIKPKIGDKFVIMSNKSPNCRHHFIIGSVVTTLEHIKTGESLYVADDGLVQIVQDCDVAPYRGNAK